MVPILDAESEFLFCPNIPYVPTPTGSGHGRPQLPLGSSYPAAAAG